jgi:hypothetical protein
MQDPYNPEDEFEIEYDLNGQLEYSIINTITLDKSRNIQLQSAS